MSIPLAPCFFPSIQVALPVFFVTYSTLLSIYRLYFHPLAHFPGPKLAAATRWYQFYFEIIKQPGRQFMFEIDRMHAQYGPIVRVTPKELHINDPEFYNKLYRSGSAVRDKRPPSCGFAGTPLGGTCSPSAFNDRFCWPQYMNLTIPSLLHYKIRHAQSSKSPSCGILLNAHISRC